MAIGSSRGESSSSLRAVLEIFLEGFRGGIACAGAVLQVLEEVCGRARIFAVLSLAESSFGAQVLDQKDDFRED